MNINIYQSATSLDLGNSILTSNPYSVSPIQLLEGDYSQVTCSTFIVRNNLNPHANIYVPRGHFSLNPNANVFVAKPEQYVPTNIIKTNRQFNRSLDISGLSPPHFENISTSNLPDDIWIDNDVEVFSPLRGNAENLVYATIATILLLSCFIVQAIFIDVQNCLHTLQDEVDVKTAGEELNSLKINNLNRVIFGHLNINSIRNKFEDLKHIVKDKIDILLISETKIDNSFPASQFCIKGYSKPYRYDRDIFGGGIIAYFREDIPCRELKSHKMPCNTEGSFVEVNIREKSGSYFSDITLTKEIYLTFFKV